MYALKSIFIENDVKQHMPTYYISHLCKDGEELWQKEAYARPSMLFTIAHTWYQYKGTITEVTRALCGINITNAHSL